MIEITSPLGIIKHVKIDMFSPMDGWDIQRKFLDFAASTDKDFRIKYIMEVLAYAKVMVGEAEIPMKTIALIDNHLETWRNIETVFEAVLRFNEIDPATHAERPNYWAKVGGEMAVAFIAETTRLMGPAFTAVANLNNKE